jgi:hypothetical protein
VYAEGREAGYSERTIRRAQQALNVDAYREGFGKHGVWLWRLLAKAASEPKGVQEKNVDAYEGAGRLCKLGELIERFARANNIPHAEIEDMKAAARADPERAWEFYSQEEAQSQPR